MYQLIFSHQAQEDIVRLKRSESSAYKKLERLLVELLDHPYTGTGRPKPLSGDRAGQWSRRITEKHRLVYSVNDVAVTVLVLTAAGHYDDK